MTDDIEPTALLGPLRAGLRLVRLFQRWRDGPDRTAVYRDHYEQWTADVARALQEHVQDVEMLAGRLDALEQDRERVLVLGNLGFEAWREANERRRAMLGTAAVATVFSPLSAAHLARIERTIRMLDPEDLEALAMFAVPVPGSDAYERLLLGHLGGAAVVASGCVRLVSMGGGYDVGATTHAELTPLGVLVLEFMGRSLPS